MLIYLHLLGGNEHRKVREEVEHSNGPAFANGTTWSILTFNIVIIVIVVIINFHKYCLNLAVILCVFSRAHVLPSDYVGM